MENENIVFEDYLRNSLTKEEQKAFRLSLERDPEFRERFELFKSVRDTMTKDKTNEQVLKSKLAPLEEKYFNTNSTDELAAPIRKLMFFKAAAALVVLLASIVAFQQFQTAQQTPTQIVNNYYYVKNINVDRSEGQGNQNIFQQKYDAANTAYQNGNDALAINSYQHLIGSNHALTPYAEWNLMLVYFKNGLDNYKPLLEKISKDTAHPFHEKATAFSKELN